MSEAEGQAKMGARDNGGSEEAAHKPDCGETQSRVLPKRRRSAKSENLITLKAMVDGAKTTPRAVRLYEAEKLISAAQRSSGGHRLFEEGELDKLRLIIDLRACGFSIEEIRELMAARQTSPSKESAMALQTLLHRHIEGLRRKLALITELGREFQCAVETLDRCATCENPGGKQACMTCDVLTSRAAPRCMRFI